MDRHSGILMHISSLPSPYGIGTLGAEARKFADFLASGGQSCWQLLPVGPTSYGDSPYQSFSSYAGNPYFIDLDDLAADGLLEPGEYRGLDWGDDPQSVDYGLMYAKRYPVLKKAGVVGAGGLYLFDGQYLEFERMPEQGEYAVEVTFVFASGRKCTADYCFRYGW